MALHAERLAISDVILIRPKKYTDSRGYFMETYRASQFTEIGIAAVFMQDNQARSAAKGTVRGLHFQRPPMAQAKLIRVMRGAMYDVAVDLRQRSATYGKWVATTLTAGGAEQLFIPQGFAHGYCTLEENTEVFYKCDAYYAADHEGGIFFADPSLAIEWPVSPERAVVSDRDRALPAFRDFATPFV